MGDLWVALSVLDWGVYSTYLRRLGQRYDEKAIAGATLIWGMILLLPLGLIEFTAGRPTPSAATLWAVAYLGVVAGAVGYRLWTYGLAHVQAARAASYLNLLPLVSVVSGALVLDETLGWVEVIAAGLIVTGVTLATLGHGGSRMLAPRG